MASYLGDYENAAGDREYKFRRAVDSFLAQGHPDKKLFIVADGCQQTVDIINGYSADAKLKIVCHYVPKQPLFSGSVRNAGIQDAVFDGGGIICYLDTDDVIVNTHLADISRGFEQEPGLAWVYYNDYIARSHDMSLTTMRGNMISPGLIGTSSIAHKSDMPVRWGDGYGHDWHFVSMLQNCSSSYKQISTNSYIVCHLPQLFEF